MVLPGFAGVVGWGELANPNEGAGLPHRCWGSFLTPTHKSQGRPMTGPGLVRIFGLHCFEIDAEALEQLPVL